MASDRLRNNIFYLFLVHGGNYLLPLLTFPYLVRVLGPVSFGQFSFAQATIQYFVLVTDYGFNLSASQAIAKNRDKTKKIGEIFWGTLFAKILLTLLCFLVLNFVVLLIPEYKSLSWVLYAFFLTVLGNALLPVWFFQGMEKMRPMTIATLIPKILVVPLTFGFVKSPDDVALAALFLGVANLLCGFMGLYLVAVMKVIPRLRFHWKEVAEALKEGWHIFISTAAVSLYTTSTTVVLGFISGPVAVGIFNSANTIRNVATYLFYPLTQAVYPRINFLLESQYDKAIDLLKKLVRVQGLLSLLASALIFIFAELIVRIALGSKFGEATMVLRILSPMPFLISLSNIFGIQTMLTHGYKKEFSRILIVSGIINLILLGILCPSYSYHGAAVSVLIVEIGVTLATLLFVRSKNIAVF